MLFELLLLCTQSVPQLVSPSFFTFYLIKIQRMDLDDNLIVACGSQNLMTVFLAGLSYFYKPTLLQKAWRARCNQLKEWSYIHTSASSAPQEKRYLLSHTLIITYCNLFDPAYLLSD